MFTHAYEGYLTHAYPLDELKPLSCVGQVSWRGEQEIKIMSDFLLCCEHGAIVLKLPNSCVNKFEWRLSIAGHVGRVLADARRRARHAARHGQRHRVQEVSEKTESGSRRIRVTVQT